MAVTLNASASAGLITTADTSTILQLQTGGTTALTVDASANVGIGTTPSAWDSTYRILQIGGNPIVSGTDQALALTSNAYYNSGWKYVTSGRNAAYYEVNKANGGIHAWYTAASGTAGNTISFTQAMTLDASGNLGVGTTSPSAKLQVDASNFALATSYATLSSNFAVRTTTTSAANVGGEIALGGYSNGTSGAVDFARIHGKKENSTAGNVSGYLAFEVSNDGGPAPYIFERARITSGGNLIVGATSSDYKFRVVGFSHFGDAYDAGNYGVIQISREAAQGTQFHLSFVRTGQAVAGMGFLNNSNTLAIQNASTNAGNGVTLTIGSTAWGTTSDERKKDVLGQFQDAITKLSNWRTVYFKYKTDESDAPQRIGLMAQDVQATVPEAVSVEEDEIGTLQLRYTELIPVLVKAIQEQQAIIQTLTDRITALEGTTP